MSGIIKINEKDNVAVALEVLPAGAEVNVGEETVKVSEDIPQGHKIALCDIRENEQVIKYGYPIGSAKAEIKKGSHVHVHNVRTNLSSELSYSYHPAQTSETDHTLPKEDQTFMGYERKDGRVGVRNELWIIPTVGCVNANAKAIERACVDLVSDHIDAVVSFTHPYGCSQMGDDQEHTLKALSDLIRHPNAGGVLVLGLGCENSNIGVLKNYLGDYDAARIRFLNCQDVSDELVEGEKILRELALICETDTRTSQSLSKLIIGMKCGGSDGLSGITANPVVGLFSDRLVSAGGSTILTEVPEMFGAEQILMERAADEAVFEKIVNLINGFKGYFRKNGETISENPSPGNKAGGITTLEDKALGCTQKSGSARVVDVLSYTERVGAKCGLHLLEAPGNDLVASTALVLAGAQIVLFTTGRGTPFACPVPTLKISTNSQLFEKKNNWIDFDCGRALDGSITLKELAEELYDMVLSLANGTYCKSEQKGFREIAIWKQGVTL